MKKIEKTGNELIDFMNLNSTDINFLFKERKIQNTEHEDEVYFVPIRIALLVLFTYIDTLATIYDLYKPEKTQNQKKRINFYSERFIFTDENKKISEFKPFFDNGKIQENLYDLRCSITHFTGISNTLGKVIYINKINLRKVIPLEQQRILEQEGFTIFIVEDFKELIMKSSVNLLNMFANELIDAKSQGKEREYQDKFNEIYRKLEQEGSKGFDSLS